MRVDAWTLRAVASELAAMLTGARIDPIIAPTPQAVAMVCYRDGQNRWLLLSAHPQLGRVHLLPAKPQKLVAEPSTFVMLLRKYVEGARIQAIRAVPWERIIEIDARLGGPEGQTVTLIAEIMGNLSNIILVDADRMILGALHHVSHAVNRYRVIFPGQPYLPPPPQTHTVAGVAVPRLLAPAITAASLSEALADEAPNGLLWKALVGHVAGLSPDIAQEVVCRAQGNPQTEIAAATPAPVAAALRDLAIRAERDDWQPTAIMNAEGAITDGALWPPCVGADRPQRPATSVNELLATLFAAREWGASIESASGDLRRTLKNARDRLTKKRTILQGELDALNAADRLRHEGEMLLAFATDIPEGATSFAVPDLGDGAPPLTITLDPQHTTIENANARFTRYHKMRRAAEAIPPQLAATEIALAQVAQLLTDLDLADTLADLAHVRAEVAEARLGAKERPDAAPKKKKPTGGKPQKGKTPPKPRLGGDPLRFTSPDGLVIYVGKNSHQNEYVTFDLGTGGDIWLHARGIPGAHAIIKTGGRPVPPTTLDFAASLAAWFSQSRTAGSVPIDYTEQRLVRHLKDGGPGMVTYSKEHTIPATPRDPASKG